MVNVQYIEEAIEKKGIKRSKIAEEMGITTQTLRNKFENDGSFSCEEAFKLCELLDIPGNKRAKIFFAPDVEKGGQDG